MYFIDIVRQMLVINEYSKYSKILCSEILNIIPQADKIILPQLAMIFTGNNYSTSARWI